MREINQQKLSTYREMEEIAEELQNILWNCRMATTTLIDNEEANIADIHTPKMIKSLQSKLKENIDNLQIGFNVLKTNLKNNNK